MRRYDEGRPAAVILDIVMPGHMDGLDALAAFKKIDRDVPIIILSGQGRTATVVQAMKLGASDFVSKPFDDAELEAAARQRAAAAQAHPGGRDAARAARVAVEPHDAVRPQRADGRGARPDRARRRHRRHRADPRRKRHRQGARRARAVLVVAPPRQAVRQGELRGAAGRAARVGALRLRARRVHRRDPAQARQVRVRQPRHDVPRRDRRDELSAAGQAAAGAAGRRVLAPRRQARRPRRRPDRRRHQQGSRAGGRRRPVPRGSLLPAQRRLHQDAAAARAARRDPGALPTTS